MAVSILFFVCGAGNANWLARLPSFADQLKLTEKTLGMMLLGCSAGALVAFRLANRLMARWGSSRVAVASAIAFCTLLAGPGLTTSPLAATVVLVALGASSGLLDVSMNVQALALESRGGRAIMSSLHGLCSLGGLVGAATGAWAAHRDWPLGWHLAAVGLVLGLACMATASGLLPEQGQKSTALLRPSGALLLLSAVALCSSVGEGAMADWIGIYLRRELHTDMSLASAGFVAFSVAMVAGRLAGDWLVAIASARAILTAGGTIAALGLGLGIAANTPLSIIVGSAACGVGLSPIIPTVLRVSGSMYPNTPASAVTTVATISYGGFLLGPPCIGLLADKAGLRAGLGLVVVAATVLALVAQRLRSSVGATETRLSS